MSEMEVTEGQLLSQDFGVGSPPTAVEATEETRRPIELITQDIKTHKMAFQYHAGMMLAEAIELGRYLEEAKAALPHGRWGAYLEDEIGLAPSTAQNFMRIFREYGDTQQSLFGGIPKSQTFGNLTYSKALRLLTIPDEEERERFAIENDVEHMSVRELNEALKARDKAEEKAAAAEEVTRKLRQENERLQEELTDQGRVYEAKLTSAGVEADQARAAVKEAQEAQKQAEINARRLQSELSAVTTAATTAEVEHTQLLKELEELRNRPAEADTSAVEAARQAAIAEMTEKVDKAKDAKKQAEEKRKATEEALEAAQKELAELKAKGPEIRELTQEEKDALTAEAVEKIKAESAERMQALKKQLSKADPDTTTLMVLFKSWKETYTKMWETLHRIEAADSDKAQRLQGGIRKALETALEQMT